ncbi:vasorin precursor [Silurus asotus]|uniref:Vasorin n=1 Tax=Silurus asotus TaxID=30991 RepID=A0AAD5AMK0_SILAS|nr:vasorin precursor [Silurus asotus]
MKPFHCLLLPLLLYLQMSSWALVNSCPKDCTCLNSDSIFCFARQATTMPPGVPESTKKLYVFKNGIETIEQEDFIGLESLEMLDLSQNKVNELPAHVFEPLSSLRNLDLSSNQITHIFQNSFAGLELLERLYLHSNSIRSIHPAAFDGLERLIELKLYRNKMTTIPALKMPNLLLLDLRFNKISSLGPADLQAPKLESLKLGGLGLTTLNQEFLGSFKNLHELDISNNQLKVFPRVLSEAMGLVTLSLAGNPMGPLKWKHFENLTELQDLDISNLSLQSLPENMTMLFPHLKKITVAENPFNCLCTLAWFHIWLRNNQIMLGRTEETRCHFPPRNAGKVLERLGHNDFGCPVTTTISPATTTTLPPPLITTLHSTTGAIPLKPSNEPFSETDIHPLPPVPASPSSSAGSGLNIHFCPSNICLNGGTCWLDHQSQFKCTCPRETSGKYCENKEDLYLPENVSTASINVLPEIFVNAITSSSILVDFNRYVARRSNIHTVKLTYRNLSGSDKRPQQRNIPAIHQTYTLRGLLPNSTYSICASLLDETTDVDRVCTEAQTLNQQHTSAQVEDPQLTTMLLPALTIVLLLVLMAIAAGVACYMHRKKKAQLHLYCDPSQLELEGVKVDLDNEALPQKQPDIMSSQSAVQKDFLDYEMPLIQDCCVANNTNTLKPC